MSLNSEIRKNIVAALAEDIGNGDLSTKFISTNQSAKAFIVSREDAILCGNSWVEACFKYLSNEIKITGFIAEGSKVRAGEKLCELHGDARALLAGERVALNFLQTLSATATLTRRYVDAVRGTDAVIMDTRKTIPGLRIAQKYAVKIGGGENHRAGLYDAILIKENHITAAGGIKQALRLAKTTAPEKLSVQIEVESLVQLADALEAGATLILLDNFSLDQLHDAVYINTGHATLEASGGVTIENVRTIAETGVNRISVGALTKNVAAIDISMLFI